MITIKKIAVKPGSASPEYCLPSVAASTCERTSSNPVAPMPKTAARAAQLKHWEMPREALAHERKG
jgi:hypothetical protein